MGESLRDALNRGARLISDGGIGTELQKRGLEPGGCGESWSVLHPDAVKAIHRSYIEAGSEIVTTNSFNGNAFALGRWELAGKVRDYARAAAKIAREAAGDEHYVMGSVGPCGGFLEPLGEITVAQLEASLREQVAGLIEGGVDAVLFETYSALDELEVCLRVARELSAPLIFVSLTYEKVRGGFRTMMGVSPEQAAAFAEEHGADAVGANCGTSISPREFAELARQCRAATGLPIVAQPNGGTPHLEGERIVYPMPAQEWAREMVEIAATAQIVGGCCGCGPDHMRQLREMVTNEEGAEGAKGAEERRGVPQGQSCSGQG